MTRKNKKAKYGKIKAPMIILVLVLLLSAEFFRSNYTLTVSEHIVFSDKLPQEFDGYRIAQISDLHGQEFGSDNARLVALITELRPDIIVVTGDLIDSPDQGETASALFEGLCEAAPVYFVTGNHEWASGGLKELKGIMKDCGVTFLDNRWTALTKGGSSIILAGAEDPGGYADSMTGEELAGQIRDSAGEGFTVMLYHRNDALEKFATLGVDLLLCGHAHGGLVRLPFTDGLIGPQREFLPTYTSGVYKMNDTTMVVSRGLGGFYGIRCRLLNPPDIPVITLRQG